MGYQRAHSSVITERVIHWFLYKKTIPMDINQLADLLEILDKPVRLGYGGTKWDEVHQLMKVVSEIHYKKKYPGIKPVEKDDDES